MHQVHQEIETLVRAKYPILYVTSWEERRVTQSLQEIAERLKRGFHTWSVTQGLKPPMRPRMEEPQLSGPSSSPELRVLIELLEAPEFSLVVLKDFHPYLRDPRTIRLLRDLAGKLRGRSVTLVLLSPSLVLPKELEKDITVVEYPLPDQDTINALLNRIQESIAGDDRLEGELEPEARELMVHSAQGLTEDEIESALARSLVRHRKFDVETIIEEKKQIVRKTGMLEYYPANATLADVGGQDLLKKWLKKRSRSFTDAAREFGIPFPKGVLLIGVQGCGKSLVARAVAATYNLPMLKMDVGRIFGSLVGQSEDNMRRAISIAESLAPCVLWIDELEKGFSGMGGSGVSDSGTTARVFSTFLTWMQEKSKPVFIVATANDVSALPPELLRKGRFDEIFFIDLPEHPERQLIFEIHLRKRNRDPKKFTPKALADATDGFSGAEIEQVVIGALNHAFSEDRELIKQDLIDEANSQVPLSRTMAEDIAALRYWASTRARPSSKPPEPTPAKTSTPRKGKPAAASK